MPRKNPLSPEQKVLAYIRDNKLVSGGEKVVVAVSGGADSVCLLYTLADLRKELDIKLHIAHLNHCLRGKESDAEAGYVRKLAEKLKIPATVESRDVNLYRAQHHISLEEAAREVRYNFLAEVTAKVGANRAAVGHTSDDNIETILMHLIRGSGTRGMRGLLPISKWNSEGKILTIIRPLLELSRKDTTACCRRHNLKPRTDTSNLSKEPLRNRIRLELLPELRKYNPRVKDALLRTARIAADDLDFIETEARQLQDKVIRKEDRAVVLAKKDFLALPLALQRQLLRISIESLLGSLKDIEASHIEDIILALDKPAGKIIGLPFGLNFAIEYDRYVLAPDATSLCPFPVLEGEFKLKIPGKSSLAGWYVAASLVASSIAVVESSEPNSLSACFDLDRVGKNLTVRSRLPGDCFQPLGMAQPKKLNRFMIDARIPQAWRQRIPIVCSGPQVIWVVGWRIDERTRVRVDTRKVLRLIFKRG